MYYINDFPITMIFEMMIMEDYVDVLWSVVLLELDNHPDHNNGPDLRTLRKS